METVTEKKNIHHGNNVRLARAWKKITQDDLADRLNIYQSEVSKIESQEEIEDKTLEKISKALNVPVDFLKEFEPEAAMQSFIVSSNEVTINNNEDSKAETNLQKNVTEHFETKSVVNEPVDKVSELYERLLEKEREIAELKSKLK